MLDLVFVDDTDIISSLGITTRLGNSDHLSIELTLDGSLGMVLRETSIEATM